MSTIEELEAKVIAQQARIEQLNATLNKFLDSHEECTDFDGFTAYIVSMDDFHDAQEAINTKPDDLSALRAHDAAIWREAMQIAEDSRDKATMSKYSSVPECRAARDMAECLSKAYCHKADAIEKGGDK